MEIGFVGLGRMGKNMVLRLLAGGHRVVAWNRSSEPMAEVIAKGATAARDFADLVAQLTPPRVVWVMLPAGDVTEKTLGDLAPLFARGDILVDGGNAHYKDSRRRAAELAARGLMFVDAGTSGGIWGLEIGYCLMVGGERAAVDRIAPVLATLAPPDGFLHVGGPGAGHFVKMVHNGIEYGMMQAYAEGFELIRASDYAPDLGQVAHLWNQGSVVRSWLLELAERALRADPELARLDDYVEDSGEGRWTVTESIERAVPLPVLTLALQMRFRSRQSESFAGKMLAALRREFGGHAVRAAESASPGKQAGR
jgi:6-phosphogluconate dehydrogenase